MSFMESMLMALGLLPGKELASSMQRSKTFTAMVIVGVILFASFVLFLLKMAGAL
ncbi:hypothetical protein [Alteromonas gilva]|uniref:Uncharacterized protein n=1 Tax=Alteromonas gilva TaxID=2987522 RepID=A0ABT5L2R7_9ALTE|nr:hypothetical protein [Alteromonas gilva]MDC8831349.1 hypothetical protein [Alteromonas gilva]